jgi:hypothetical protein
MDNMMHGLHIVSNPDGTAISFDNYNDLI